MKGKSNQAAIVAAPNGHAIGSWPKRTRAAVAPTACTDDRRLESHIGMSSVLRVFIDVIDLFKSLS
jgi:hypothetical protein